MMRDEVEGTEPAVMVRGLVKRYPGLEVLGGLDLIIGAGERVAVLGPSGSGKSTLLHIVGTLDRPTSGSVLVLGHDVSTLSDRALAALRARAIGFVFQQFFLLDGMTALENVENGLLYSGVSRGGRRRRAVEALDRVGLAGRAGHHPAMLSGGERQRVAIARALLAGPALVLADEPTGNLDTRSGQEVVALLRELNDRGSTLIVVTHDQGVAAAMDRRIEIRDGLIESDTGREYTRPASVAEEVGVRWS
jgi:putative ABC transport system ATP-binding protein